MVHEAKADCRFMRRLGKKSGGGVFKEGLIPLSMEVKIKISQEQ